MHQMVNLTDHALEVVKPVTEKCIIEVVKFQEMEFRFMPKAGAYNTILILKILQE